MNSLVSYGKLRPAFIGALGVIARALLNRPSTSDMPVKLSRIDNVIEFSDSGVWGGESVDPAAEMQVFRVSDFRCDFELNYATPPYRSLTEGQQEKFALKEGDILVVKSSGSAKQVVSGRVAVFESQNNGRFAASNFLMRLRPDRTIVDPHYLAFVLGSPPIREEIANSVKTMTYPNLPYKLYRTIPIPLVPIPDQRRIAAFLTAYLHKKQLPSLPIYLSEQQRIVARIEELAAKIEEARGLRRQAVEGAGALVASRSTELFADLGNAERRPISTLGENGSNPIQIGPFGAQLHAEEFVEYGVPVLNVGNVWPTGLRFNKIDYVTPEKATQLRRYTIKQDDLLFARSGATLGKVCVVPSSCDGWLMTGHLFRVRFDQKCCDPRFAFAALRSVRSIRDQVFGQVRGATRPGFNTTLLGNVELPLPPLPEQRCIVAYLDDLQAKVDVLKRLQTETSAELDALLPSVLDKAFKGEL